MCLTGAYTVGSHAQPTELTVAERGDLERRVRARTSSQQAALRARIVLQATGESRNTESAATVATARHGTADLLSDFALLAGLICGISCPRHRSAEFIRLLQVHDALMLRDQVIHLTFGPVKLHFSAEVAVNVACRPWRFRFHWLPVHGSWLSFIEAWFAILTKKCLDRGEWADFDQAATDILAFIATYDAHQAHPFTWRKGIRFYQRLKDKLAQKATSPPPATEAA